MADYCTELLGSISWWVEDSNAPSCYWPLAKNFGHFGLRSAPSNIFSICTAVKLHCTPCCLVLVKNFTATGTATVPTTPMLCAYRNVDRKLVERLRILTSVTKPVNGNWHCRGTSCDS